MTEKSHKQTADKILQKYEDENEMHFHQLDRKFIIQAMDEYAISIHKDITDKEIQLEAIKRIKEKLEDGYTIPMSSHFSLGFVLGAEWYREQLKKE